MEGAIREAVEETGIDPQCLIAQETHIDDHGIWSYQTIIAKASAELEAHELNDESHEIKWVLFDDVTRLPLHPSFAKSWPDLRSKIENLITPI